MTAHSSPWASAAAPVRKTVRVAKPRAVLEWQLQAWFVNELHKLERQGWPLTCAGDMNAGKRGRTQAAIAKLTGLTAGEPDVRIYFNGGRMMHVEIKRKTGVMSQAQIERHATLNALGFDVRVAWLIDEAHARKWAVSIALEFLPLGPKS